MRYVTHHGFHELALCGENLDIPYGTELEARGYCLLSPEGRPVCYRQSENAKRHFAVNDDGRGLERGALTYAIAYGDRDAGNGRRFSEAEAEMLARDWSHFLRQDLDVILFNERFFTADVGELREMAGALGIRAQRQDIRTRR